MDLLDEIKVREFPPIFGVEQTFIDQKVSDIEADLQKQLSDLGDLPEIRPGAKIAVAVGSRDIKNLQRMLRVLLKFLKDREAEPFIIPAMGSHGGATVEGQMEVLRCYGITEDSMGVPFRPAMAATQLGSTDQGMPVFFSQAALEADAIVMINKIKLHTNFRGPVESGLLKMLVVGLGKHDGALTLHNYGFDDFSRHLVEAAEVIQRKVHVALGVAVIENAYLETAKIVAVKGENILRTEPPLLEEAKNLMARIPFRKIDVLVILEMGKNISGDGMDTNVIGRYSSNLRADARTPEISRIAVLDLTEESHGNAVGIGYADVTTRRLVARIDPVPTYTNAVTANAPGACKIPIIMDTDRQAIEVAVKTCGNMDIARLRMVIIKNTLNLRHFYVSKALAGEAAGNQALQIVGQPAALDFDAAGNVNLHFPPACFPHQS
jgi:hypothetical protein